MVRVCAYLRVSSKEQIEDNQLAAIKTFVDGRGWQLTETYQERESAWKAGHQHELKRLLNDLKTGRRKYDKVVVWSIDRLTREGIGRIFDLMATFNVYGCQVLSVKEPFLETTGLATDLLLTLLAWVAKFESDRRSERIKAGNQRKAKKENWTPGRQAGAKDKVKRDKTGYLLRYAKRKRVSNILPQNFDIENSDTGSDFEAINEPVEAG